MAVWGMDIQQVKELAALLGQKASDVDGIISTITSKLNATQWEGPDAQKFRSDWSGQHTQQLKSVAEALRATQTAANKNAAEQETTSGS